MINTFKGVKADATQVAQRVAGLFINGNRIMAQFQIAGLEAKGYAVSYVKSRSVIGASYAITGKQVLMTAPNWYELSVVAERALAEANAKEGA